MKLISLFNVSNTLGDITNLQFREKFKAGFYADSLRGAIIIDSEGILIDTPIVFEGSSGQYSWSGYLKRAPDGNIRDLSAFSFTHFCVAGSDPLSTIISSYVKIVFCLILFTKAFV